MKNNFSSIDKNTTLVWLRRDLRLDDHAALYYAVKDQKNVLPIFIFDTIILDALEDKRDRRVEFIHQTLHFLKARLEELGSSLLVLHGDPVKLFATLEPKAVYANHDYEPYARQRDEMVNEILKGKNIPFRTYKDQVIFERKEVVKNDGAPYTVFTPYSVKWKASLTKFFLSKYPTGKYFEHLKKISPLPFPALEDIGFSVTGLSSPPRVISTSLIRNYHRDRDFPSIQGTSRLSVHLRFGTLSIRRLASLALKKNETWLNELIWRDFYQMILWNFPQAAIKSFKPAYDRIKWRNDPAEFAAWCAGKTGYPIVDAGMRELNATGFMHNRVRMIVASFLTKHLLIDWRWGEAYFGQKLLDYDLASNNGGWQWAAGSGCDAAPYFRVFNPTLQAEKFDPQNIYIKKWVPEIGTDRYPFPIVDHKTARIRAVKVYSEALKE